MIDDQTQHLSLPLPHEDNLLEEDVARLRAALSEIDTRVHQLNQLVASNDPAFDNVQEIVTALKANVATAATIASSLASHTQNYNNPHGTTASQIGAIHSQQRGAANGVASLDAAVQVPYSQLKPGKPFFLAQS